jgi:hypothetical protein
MTQVTTGHGRCGKSKACKRNCQEKINDGGQYFFTRVTSSNFNLDSAIHSKQ